MSLSLLKMKREGVWLMHIYTLYIIQLLAICTVSHVRHHRDFDRDDAAA